MKCFVVLSAVVACGFAAPVADAVAAPAVAAYAAPAVATVAHATPAVATYAHAAPVAVATAPVVHQVGYNVHHQVPHVPQVSAQKHVSTHPPSHVINHAPVVGAPLAHHGVVAAPLLPELPVLLLFKYLQESRTQAGQQDFHLESDLTNK